MRRQHPIRGDAPPQQPAEYPVTSIGCESGAERLARIPSEDPVTWRTRRGDLINTWRENMTGLSQVHNLYFVAVRDRVHIYVPTYPHQTLGSHPAYVLEVDKSGSDNAGYVDPRCPHSINHLVIAQLGTKEILLMSCDDGDVIAYFTDKMQDLVERNCDSDSSERGEVPADQARPFLLANVGKSAWGLAVHTEARKIAVSANTRHVTVFEFALQSQGMDHDDEIHESLLGTDIEAEAMDGLLPLSRKHPEVTFSRRHDRRVMLKDHRNNLPTVTFCNTDDDKEGRWLACGDISGTTYIWDLFATPLPRIVEYSNSEFCRGTVNDSNGAGCMCDPFAQRFPHAVWGLHWLDPKTFRPVSTDDMQRCIQPRSITGPSPVMTRPVDISHQRLRLSRAADRFAENIASPTEIYATALDDFLAGPGHNQPLRGANDEDDDIDENEQTPRVGHSDDEDNMTPAAMWTADVLAGMDTADEDDSEDDSDNNDEDEEEVYPEQYTRAPLLPQFRRDIKPPASPNPSSTPLKAGQPPKAHPSSPLLQLSMHDIFLQQSRTHNNEPHPIYAYHDPFKQTITDFYMSRLTEPYNRISLSHSIPELGLMIVGTPKGRVAIISLQRCNGLPVPISSSSQSSARSSSLTKHSRTKFTVSRSDRDVRYFPNLEWILPFREEEEAGKRPLCALVGIAAGPMQGGLGAKYSDSGASSMTRRRWRLMLTWMDHSVLSYELGHGESGGIDCEALLV